MSKRYLMQAPTLIVIGVAGYAALPALLPGGDASPTKPGAKPPSASTGSPTILAELGRNPFLVERPPGSPAGLAATSPGSTTRPSKGAEQAAPPRPAVDEERLLADLRLDGTYIGGRDRIAIIDNRVYSRGERLRKADGSPLPYVIADVRKDHAVIRGGRRDFMLGFSNEPRAAVAKAADSAPAKASKPADAPPTKLEASIAGQNASPTNRADRNPTDPGGLLRQLLSGILGGPGGGTTSRTGLTPGLGGSSASDAISGLLGGASGTKAGTSGVPVNADTIQAGIDALSGKYDNIGRAGDTSGGTTP